MNVHTALKQHGQEAMVLAEVYKDGKRLVLALERSLNRINLIDHNRSDDVEDVRGLDLESLAKKVADWLKAQGLDQGAQDAALAAFKAKLAIPVEPTE
jgi:hypothetical protein